MGGASDGTFFDGPAPECASPESLGVWDISDFRAAHPEQMGKLVKDALERGNKDMAYFALGVLAAQTGEPSPGEERRGLWGRARFIPDPEALVLRQRRLAVLGRFLHYFRPFDDSVASKDSSVADSLGYNFKGTVNN
jgi:hypothetical protein